MTRSRYHWPLLRNAVQKAALMDQMMERLGIDPATAVRLRRGAAYRSARTQCLSCPYPGTCLEVVGLQGETAKVPPFCRNAAYFQECISSRRKDQSPRH